MIYERLLMDGAVLTVYAPSNYPGFNQGTKRPFLLICPGGGYERCSERESEPVAIRFMSMGYACAVLHYTVSPDGYWPVALHQLAHSVEYVRNHCTKYFADPSRIIVAGFSAGGHLAACLGTMWREISDGCRPDGLLLCYPVINSGEYEHASSFRNLLGSRYAELKDSLSLEKRVTPLTPPAFIWHTKTDESVNYMNSVLFARALEKCGIPHELRLFPSGGHGLSLADESVTSPSHREVNRQVSVWPELADSWLRKNIV